MTKRSRRIRSEKNGIYYQINGHVTYMIGDKYMYTYDIQNDYIPIARLCKSQDNAYGISYRGVDFNIPL